MRINLIIVLLPFYYIGFNKDEAKNMDDKGADSSDLLVS